uniref:Ribonuclease VapC n=1 Tax=uncultured Thiotrichaceae bacterium TaxID=298394 RepID=A0A6S6TSC3_9GAMM|nr:MAG: Ribonuclease VapC [uncultured Thiotrichaceae bacterium]
MLYMLDTNVCIGIINNKPSQLRHRLFEIEVGQVGISQIVLYELEYGICSSQQQERNRRNLTSFLQHIQVFDWQQEQSKEAALVRCELMEKGNPIGHYDTLIAAHARSLSATLVTHNMLEFERVGGVILEDWEVGS